MRGKIGLTEHCDDLDLVLDMPATEPPIHPCIKSMLYISASMQLPMYKSVLSDLTKMHEIFECPKRKYDGTSAPWGPFGNPLIALLLPSVQSPT